MPASRTAALIKAIPLMLIWLRLALGVALLLLSLHPPELFSQIAAVLLIAGVLSDILDGIIARRLGLSTIILRRLDSAIDQAFWMLAATAALLHAPDAFASCAVWILILLATEALTYVVSFARFRKEVSTHAIASKIWTLLLAATICALFITGSAPVLLPVCIAAGILTRLEIIAILLLLRQWTPDVPSIYHARLLRQGKAIRRHKLFNG